jgi:hypothetical protein
MQRSGRGGATATANALRVSCVGPSGAGCCTAAAAMASLHTCMWGRTLISLLFAQSVQVNPCTLAAHLFLALEPHEVWYSVRSV